jgi:cell wall-associated NlpC family hydrolase
MATDTAIANAISKFIDQPHAIGNPSQGWDCLNSLLDFYREMGVKLPDEFEGYTEANYGARWEKSQDKCRQALERFILGLGEQIAPAYMMRGDLLVFKTPKFPAFPAICLGNGHMMIVPKEGVKVVPIHFFDRFLTGVRRLIP